MSRVRTYSESAISCLEEEEKDEEFVILGVEIVNAADPARSVRIYMYIFRHPSITSHVHVRSGIAPWMGYGLRSRTA